MKWGNNVNMDGSPSCLWGKILAASQPTSIAYSRNDGIELLHETDMELIL